MPYWTSGHGKLRHSTPRPASGLPSIQRAPKLNRLSLARTTRRHVYLSNSLKFVDPEEALRDVATVEKFIEFVLGHLTKPVRTRLELLLREDYLGHSESTGEIARLFGQAIGEGFVILDGAPAGSAGS